MCQPTQLQLPLMAAITPTPQTQESFQAEGLRLRLWRGWLADSPGWFQVLRQAIPWQQPSLSLVGRQWPIPRWSCWVADVDHAYAYSGLEQSPQAWTPTLLRLRGLIEAQLDLPPGGGFNGVLLNYYRDGRDTMGWHADDEPELDPEAPIASLSLGASRTFRLRPRGVAAAPLDLELGDGDLLVMDPPTQRHWQHALPRRLRLREPRLNLTFRKLRSIRHAGGRADR